MHRSKRYFVISTAAIALTFGFGCGGDKDKTSPKPKTTKPDTAKPDTAKPDTAKPDTAKPDTAKPVAGGEGVGTIAGSITFTGTVPEPKPIKGAKDDPFCATQALTDQRVLVADGKLANVFVRLAPGSATGEVPEEQVKVGQDKCMYVPRVQGAMAGQEMLVNNGDPTMHNVHAFNEGGSDGTDELFNLAHPKGAADIAKEIPEEAKNIKIKCDVHPWMVAYVMVTDHPFFAVSGADGSFTIPNVPAGKYTLEAWHETLGTKTVEIEVAAGGSVDPKFSFGG